jgi:C1A family cysteine protease
LKEKKFQKKERNKKISTMKAPLFLALMALALIGLSTAAKSKDDIFNEYAQKFKIHFRRNANLTDSRERISRKYQDFDEQDQRFKTGDENFTRSLYEFSHLSDSEFANYHLGAREPEANETIFIDDNDEGPRRGRALNDPPATSFQWSDAVVGKVKSQGSCGCCYAFAAIGAIKSQLAVKNGIYNFDLSEQDAMECSRGCVGGWDYTIYRDYSQKYSGVAAYNYGATHSYTATSSGCKASSRARVPNTKVISYGTVANNEKTIRTYLYNYGPLYARFDVYSNFYEYSSGIYTKISGSRLGGHAGELAVGFLLVVK